MTMAGVSPGIGTHQHPLHPGTHTAYYVAPLTKPTKHKRLKVVGERLTGLLPADMDNQIYYQRKGYRLATEEDIRRLQPAMFEVDDEDEA